MSKTIKKKTNLIVSALVGGSLILAGMNQSQPMTYQEMQTLVQVYNYELSQDNTFENVRFCRGFCLPSLKYKRFFDVLDERIKTREYPAKIKLGDKEVNSEDYKELVTQLINKRK